MEPRLVHCSGRFVPRAWPGSVTAAKLTRAQREPFYATLRRRMSLRCISVVPPHKPASDSSDNANSRHSRRTGHDSHNSRVDP
jgi:hypothetical protein